MKKVGIITFTRGKNYGASLQAYGLYKYIEDKGFDVSFIDYYPMHHNIYSKDAFIEEKTKKLKFWGKNTFTKWLFSEIKYPKIKKSYEFFYDFLDRRTKFTKPYYFAEDVFNDPPEADIYISGSDQIWNNQFNSDKHLDSPYYLAFVKSGKRISYASSFGKSFIPDEQKSKVKEWLGCYDALSVREESGQKILAEMGLVSNVVADPTIICPGNVWEETANKAINSNYYVLYQLRNDERIYRAVEEISRKNGKKLIAITYGRNRMNNYIKEMVDTPPVGDWLSYIRYSDGVFTDSYHACVFSILFHKPFIAYTEHRKEMSSRITDLLSKIDLSQQNVGISDKKLAEEMLHRSIDWKHNDQLLESFRKGSTEWLDKALETE